MKRVLGVCILFLLLWSALKFNSQIARNSETATVWMDSKPVSSDPIEYDLLPHHIVFRSFYSSAVSQYHGGQFEPVLVDHWSNDREFREWNLRVRPGLHFENGDTITALDIVNSWCRIGHLMRQRGSESGFIEKLVGYENWKGIGFPIEGLRINGNTIELKFRSPFRNFLEVVSFGLYSVVHSSCFDPKNGAWRDSNCLISSSGYRISNWNEKGLELLLRDDWPLKNRSKSLRKIQLTWEKQKRETADIIVGSSLDDEIPNQLEFYGTPTSNIAYVRCNSWPERTGPCGTTERRIALRNRFYQQLSQLGWKPDLTFFPLSIPGIQAFSISPASTDEIDSEGMLRYRVSSLPQKPFRLFSSALKLLETNGGMKILPISISATDARKEIESNSNTFSFDLVAQFTGILIESPQDDIRFMFMSKEGIRLPDIDGKIVEELRKPIFDTQTINELLWDQAVIWPLAHFSIGLWAKRSKFDFSEINLSLPPTDFQFIQWK